MRLVRVTIAGGLLALALAACGASTVRTVTESASSQQTATSPQTTTSSGSTSSASLGTSQATSSSEGSSATATGGGPCDGNPCIGDWQKEAAEGGTVVQCVDGTWSHAGGIQGACSDHGGESGSQSSTATAKQHVPDASAGSADWLPLLRPKHQRHQQCQLPVRRKRLLRSMEPVERRQLERARRNELRRLLAGHGPKLFRELPKQRRIRGGNHLHKRLRCHRPSRVRPSGDQGLHPIRSRRVRGFRQARPISLAQSAGTYLEPSTRSRRSG